MIKKRNLDQSLVQWIMTVTGLGPGIGELFYVAPAASSTSQYRTQLQSMGVERDHQIYTLPSLAYADMKTDRNDVMLVAPGLYTETASIDWTKDHTHLVGLGGPNIMQRFHHPNTMIFTDTAGVDYTIHLSGDFCQFHNMMLGNGRSGGSASSSNLSAMMIDGYGNYFKNMGWQGLGTTAQSGAYLCSALEIGSTGVAQYGGSELWFEDCLIGGNTYLVARTITGHGVPGQGVLRLSTEVAGAANVIFKDCLFQSRSGTATCVMIYFTQQNAVDRMWNFERCHFDNFCDAYATMCTDVFGMGVNSLQTTNMNLLNCTTRGYTSWHSKEPQATQKWLYGTGPVATFASGHQYLMSAAS